MRSPPGGQVYAQLPSSAPPTPSKRFETDNGAFNYAVMEIKKFQEIHEKKIIWVKQGSEYIDVDDITNKTTTPQIAYLEIISPTHCIHHISPKTQYNYIENEPGSHIFSVTMIEPQIVYTVPKFISERRTDITLRLGRGTQVDIGYLRTDCNTEYMNRFGTNMPETTFQSIIEGFKSSKKFGPGPVLIP
jgi:hypothetical protein